MSSKARARSKLVVSSQGLITADNLAPGAAVPDQTGNSGKFLTTNGTTASWGTVDLTTKADKTGGNASGTWPISISGNAATATTAGTASASDVYAWAKAASKPSYSYSEVGAPSTTGTNASGTWPISISGNAATASNGGVTSVNGQTGAVSFSIPEAFPSGTVMLFAQTAAPTGWTKSVAHDNKALRVVSGTAGSGGVSSFTSVFASRAVSGSISDTTAGGSLSSTAVSGSVGNTTLSTSQMPSHSHYVVRNEVSNYRAQYSITTYTNNYLAGMGGNGYELYYLNGHSSEANTGLASWNGGNGAHNHSFSGDAHSHSFTGSAHGHTFTGTSLDMAVQYVDVIIAVKN